MVVGGRLLADLRCHFGSSSVFVAPFPQGWRMGVEAVATTAKTDVGATTAAGELVLSSGAVTHHSEPAAPGWTPAQ